MILATEAETIILDLIKPFTQQDLETVDLDNANGRILATAITGKLDIPHWDNSAMDGYAVRYEDVRDCSTKNPVVLEIVEEIAAGDRPKLEIKSGQAARIFTGGMLPAGADTIVIQENTEAETGRVRASRDASSRDSSDFVKILAAPQPQEFVRHQGAFYQAGMPLLESGIVLGAADLAVIATAQCTELPVYRRPRVAILSTGDELVPPDRPLQPGQIVDSNQYALASFVASNGGIPIKLGIAPDRPEVLKQRISQAIASADLVLSTGGVSVGDYDYVDPILTELGGELNIRAVAVKPGKPLTVAKFPHCVYFGIPGNPVSALVSCWRFVEPALRKLSGQKSFLPTFVRARTSDRLVGAGKRETYLWGKLHLVDGEYEFTLAGGSHSSGNLINLAQTNGLAVIPLGQKAIAPGESIRVMQVNRALT
jgi:molybdopterin molybdotransferase